MNSDVAAMLRLCPSSPIWSAWPVRLRRSIGPCSWSAPRKAGPSVSAIQRRRASTDLSYAPKRRTLPRPSLSVAWPRVPPSVSWTTTTGLGLTTPAIGPTAPWWWHGASSIRPSAAMARAASGSVAQPSNRIAPMTAPWTGPGMRSQVIGGPECSS